MYLRSDLESAIRLSEPAIGKDKLLRRLRGASVDIPWDKLPDSVKWNLCRVKLSRGCWDWLGWELRSDWSVTVHTQRFMPIWRGEGSVIVVAEEGVGDEIMAASCFSCLPPCVIECDSRLKAIFTRSFPEHRFIERLFTWPDRKKEADYMLPLMDVFPMYRKSPKDCPGTPYLVPDPERVAYWREVLPSYTGVAWSSRHGKQKPFFVPGVSLQYGEKTPEWLFQPDLDPVADFGDQINLIAALDHIISGPMSVVHAAGALGVKTDVIMPSYGTGKVHNTLHWRYLTNLPFYNNSTVHLNWYEYKKARKLGCDTQARKCAS